MKPPARDTAGRIEDALTAGIISPAEYRATWDSIDEANLIKAGAGD